MKTKKVLISGYYGFDNFGDEAILHIIASTLKKSVENVEITAISNNPKKTSESLDISSVKTFDLKNIFKELNACDLFISGGGSLLQDTTSLKSLLYYLSLIFTAKLLGKKIFIYAQGIGPISSKLGAFLTKHILKMVDVMTVRDLDSKNLLEKWHLKPVLTADPVWNMDLVETEKKHDSKINVGIQLRNWASIDEKKLESLAESIAKNFDAGNHRFIVISLQRTKDLALSKSFENILRSAAPDAEIIVSDTDSIVENTTTIKNLDYLIAMRFHATLISLKFCIPTLALSYDPKVETLAKQSGIPFIGVENIDTERLNDKISELISKNVELKENLVIFSTKAVENSRQTNNLLLELLLR